jgi:hypothetical protein
MPVVHYDVLPGATSGSTNLVQASGTVVGGVITTGTLTGSGIGISTAIRTSPLPTLSQNCFNCVMNFTSGTGTVTYSSATTLYSFQSGGLITIDTGAGGFVDLDNSGTFTAGDIGANTNLVSGFFTTAVTADLTTGSDVVVSGAAFLSTQNTALNNYFFGLPWPGFNWSGVVSLTFERNLIKKGGGPFASTKIISGYVDNTALPEPASVILFGTVAAGLLGGLVVSRRRAAARS